VAIGQSECVLVARGGGGQRGRRTSACPVRLPDERPGVCAGYSFTRHQFTSASHSVHKFDYRTGWGERVDKEHHMKLDVMMRHADKCLQLGEKPFVSGGMKSAGPGLKG